MEFNQKLQELRKAKGLTQEELAKSLYVSRTAISKWESGRGYPSIDSLRAIAKFFSVTVDELLSGDEALTIAEADKKQNEKHLRDLTYGLIDICMALCFFLPFFVTRSDGIINPVSLFELSSNGLIFKISFCALVTGIVFTGILTLALQGYKAVVWTRSKTILSFTLSTISVLLFLLCLQPYAAAYAFVLLIIKALLLITKS